MNMLDRKLGPSSATCKKCGRSYSVNPPRGHECKPEQAVEKKSKSDRQELVDIAAWCEKTFGPIEAQRLVERAQEEMDELRVETLGYDKWTEDAVEEAADVVIILSRVPGLMDAVHRKMEKNKERQWHLKGDGTGYHSQA